MTRPAEAAFSRRALLKSALLGFTSLSLPALYRMRSCLAAAEPAKRSSIILVWLRGGASHLETFDPKPNAPSEYRGPFKPISTNVPGTQICELLPNLAGIADKYNILRSITHTGGGHPAGSLQVLSGDPDPQDKFQPKLPDWMTIANYLRSDRTHMLPNYVAVNPVDHYDNFTIAGPTYLGNQYAPFTVVGDPSRPEFAVPNVGLQSDADRDRLLSRIKLRKSLDRVQRDLDRSGLMASMDHFESQAVNLLLAPQAREAFDLSKESEATRDRYGRHQWGQQCLMARRLVEAGVEIVTTEFDGPLCGRVANWDDHGVNHHVFDAMSYRAPFFDQAVSALISDIYDRGLDKQVLIVVAGEFGRTPKISYDPSSGGGTASGAAGTVQPGRDHWPRANSMLFAGGGLETGQVIGATDRRGEDPIERVVGTHEFLATIYHHLSIDFKNVAIPDFSGRPTFIVQDGDVIPELTRRTS